jgi:hypothetical protein
MAKWASVIKDLKCLFDPFSKLNFDWLHFVPGPSFFSFVNFPVCRSSFSHQDFLWWLSCFDWRPPKACRTDEKSLATPSSRFNEKLHICMFCIHTCNELWTIIFRNVYRQYLCKHFRNCNFTTAYHDSFWPRLSCFFRSIQPTLNGHTLRDTVFLLSRQKKVWKFSQMIEPRMPVFPQFRPFLRLFGVLPLILTFSRIGVASARGRFFVFNHPVCKLQFGNFTM